VFLGTEIGISERSGYSCIGWGEPWLGKVEGVWARFRGPSASALKGE